MENADILMTIAEVAIARTGFTGVVAVFGRRSRGAWTPHELLQLRALVETSLTAFFVSFVPTLLGMVLDSESHVWRSSNAILGLAHAANLAAFFLRTQMAPSTAGQITIAAIGMAFIVTHLLVGLGLVGYAVPIFVLGLLQQIFVAVHNFVLLLIPTKEQAA